MPFGLLLLVSSHLPARVTRYKCAGKHWNDQVLSWHLEAFEVEPTGSACESGKVVLLAHGSRFFSESRQICNAIWSS